MKKLVALALVALAAPVGAREVTTVVQVGCAVIARTTGTPRAPDRLDVDLTGCTPGTSDALCTWRADGACVQAGLFVPGSKRDSDVVIRFAPAE